MSDDDIDDKLVQQHHDDDDIGDDDDDASQPVGQLSDLQLQALEQKLVDAPFNYELHQQRIHELSLRRDMPALHNAREQMSAVFPLSPDQWASWLDDERALAELDAAALTDLHERAVADYAVSSLWQRYVEHASTAGLAPASVRAVVDRAVAACGADVALGADLWRVVQRVEIALAAGDDAEAGAARVRRLALERAALPLLDDELVHREYLEWEAARDDADAAMAAIAATQELVVAASATRDELLAPHEAAVRDTALSDFARWPAWQAYIVAEQTTHQAPPQRIVALFERALVPFCLFADLWLLYGAFLAEHAGDDAVVALYERAVRNLPWSVALWAALIETHGRRGASADELLALAARALGAGLQSTSDCGEVYFATLGVLRARVARHFALAYDDTLEPTTTQRAASAIGDAAAFGSAVADVRRVYEAALAHFQGEASFSGELRHVADWAVRFERDVVAAAPDADGRRAEAQNRTRMLLGEQLRANARNVDAWLRAADFEVQLGARARARATYGTAISSVGVEGVSLIANAWLTFERMHGDAASLAQARQVVEQTKAAHRAQSQAGAADEGAAEPKRKRRDDASGKKKRARVDDEKAAEKAAAERAAAEKAAAELAAKQAAKEAAAAAREAAAAAKAAAEAAKRELVVRALPFSMTVAQARVLFEDYGTVDAMRLLTLPDGRSKGVAFCTYATHEMASRAKRELTGKKLEGRVVQVAWSKDDVNPIGAQHDETLTVYVSQLHPDVTEQELRDAFAAAAPTGVRRAVGKKFAFVEFADADALQRALALNGTLLREQPMRVLRSDPSLAEKPEKPAKPPAEQAQQPLGKPRKPALLVPRSVALKTSAAAATPTAAAAASDTVPKSNADFRALIQGKK